MSPDIPLRLALNRLTELTPAAWRRLHEAIGPPERWPQRADAELRQHLTPLQWRALGNVLASEWAMMAGVQRDLEWLSAPDVRLLLADQPDYPPLLAAIHHPPPVLFVKGDAALLHRPQLAVVGTRHPTHEALHDCRDFTRTLAQCGVVITSGLALGIDAAAHQAALDAGGATIAVLANGLNATYPSRHAALAAAIAGHGALVSEFSWGTTPRPEFFPRRNRIISGLSLGVWVVEGALKSGSLITAREALEQGRDVFARPGSLHNPQARGCHRLIREGALLVETPRDILEAILPQLVPMLSAVVPATGCKGMPPHPPRASATTTTHPSPALARLLQALLEGHQTVDVLVDVLGVSPAQLTVDLMLLTLEGRVVCRDQRYWCV